VVQSKFESDTTYNGCQDVVNLAAYEEVLEAVPVFVVFAFDFSVEDLASYVLELSRGNLNITSGVVGQCRLNST
jgi:hypothetical protein